MNLLQDFKNKPFIDAVQSFFKKLNVPFNVIEVLQTEPINIIGDKKCNEIISAIYPFGIVNDDIFKGKETTITQAELNDDKYVGILLFGVELTKSNPTRSDLAEITRQINRVYSQIPVVVVFSYADKITFANAERIEYKQTFREGEKVGKISMLKDIEIEKTHRAHQDILKELGTHEAINFDELYQYWQKVLNTKSLNKQFFKKIANWYFLSVAYSKFPFEYLKIDPKYKEKSNEELQELANQKATIRFITRMIFVWFLKEKGLISNDFFDKNKVFKLLKNFNKKNTTDYYNAILQNLFFATLNKAKEHREFALDLGHLKNKSNYDVNSLYRYENMFQDATPEKIMSLFENIPFLNGGLFDSLDNKEKKEIIDGFSRTNSNQAKMPDFLFFEDQELDFDEVLNKTYETKNKKYDVKGLFEIFNEYKFTIEENTPTETDVALDPYLLGEIFENLLAYYNPETGTTARKGSGSFYTPQEIVNYMVDESLNAYLETKIDNSTFQKYKNPEDLNNNQKTQLVQALSNVKILDPACGSGAFPMGVLYKMVDLLKHIDPDNSIWKQIQHDKIIGDKIAELEADKKAIQGLSDIQVKEKAIKAVEDRLNDLETIFNNEYNLDDYARKLYIIQNCIYGVDIQDVAIQISKLRFFLSLIVDQKNNDIKPLPNLETKFVIANTLIGIDLPKFQIMGVDDHSQDTTKALKEELKIVRNSYFKASTRKEKLKLKEQDKIIREKIANSLADSLYSNKLADVEKWKNEIEIQKKLLAEAEQMPDMVQEIIVKDLFGGETTTKVNYRKERIKEYTLQIRYLQNKIESSQTNSQAEIIRAQALKIAEWDIYNQNAQADWFDAEWMFGLSPEDSNGEIILLNKQIDAINYQIDAINESIDLKLYKISHLQFSVANNQIDVISEQIKSINDNINNLFGTINSNVNNVVNEPQSIEYKINSLNKRIEKINQELENIKASLKTQQSNGVFDIVIGNPPYGISYNKEEVATFKLKYKTINGHTEAYQLFFENSINLLKENACLAFIAPNSWQQNKYSLLLRKKILTKTNLKQIINFYYKVFENANIDTSIVLLTKSTKNGLTLVGKDINKKMFYEIDSNIWLNSKDLSIIFYENSVEYSILQKIKRDTFELSEILDLTSGYKPYQKGYGKNLNNLPLDENDVKSKIYHSKTKKDNSYKPELKGKNIEKYKIRGFDGYIKWGNWLMSFKDEKFYTNEKILLRKILGETFVCTIDNEGYYIDQSLYIGILNEQSKLNLKYILSVLNSKLLSFYFKKKYSEDDILFPQIKVNQFSQLPIKNTNYQQPFITLVNQILSDKKEGKDTSHLEHQIDVMVYHLYGLSYEEACVIDNGLSEEDFKKFRIISQEEESEDDDIRAEAIRRAKVRRLLDGEKGK